MACHSGLQLELGAAPQLFKLGHLRLDHTGGGLDRAGLAGPSLLWLMQADQGRLSV
jgi:hypothetical protein